MTEVFYVRLICDDVYRFLVLKFSYIQIAGFSIGPRKYNNWRRIG